MHRASVARCWSVSTCRAPTCAWIPAGWPPTHADALFARLRDHLPWQIHPVRLFGREYPSLRPGNWIGDAAYRYSGIIREPGPRTPALAVVRDRLAAGTGARFNGVLANPYRDGGDAMGWHADDEPGTDAMPVIAFLSLGAVRRFA